MGNHLKKVNDRFLEHTQALNILKENKNNIVALLQELEAVRNDKSAKILICGNGGSAADSQHFAAELMVRYKKDRSPFHAHALTVDTSILTAIGNDYSYDKIFSRQVSAMGNSNDYLFLISTSGNSTNLIEAAVEGKRQGMCLVGLLGNHGGKLKDYCDHAIIIGSNSTAAIQEMHIMIIHMICEIFEDD